MKRRAGMAFTGSWDNYRRQQDREKALRDSCAEGATKAMRKITMPDGRVVEHEVTVLPTVEVPWRRGSTKTVRPRFGPIATTLKRAGRPR